MRITSYDSRFRLHCIANAYWESLDFQLPPADGGGIPWRLWIDTALPSPLDISAWGSAPSVTTPSYRAEARSVVVLFVLLNGGGAPG